MYTFIFIKYSGELGYDTRDNLEHLGDEFGIYLFYFLGPYLLAISRNNGWVDIHEMFKIGTQIVTSYTVSRLNKPHHNLQFRAADVCALGVLLFYFFRRAAMVPVLSILLKQKSQFLQNYDQW